MSTITKSLRQAVCVTLAGGASLTAGAAEIDLGLIPFGAPTPFNLSVLSLPTFNDIIKFELPANGGSGYSVLNFPVPGQGGPLFNVILSTMSLVSNPDGIVGNTDDQVLKSVAGPGNSLAFTWGPTGGGKMYLNVTGIANGSLGGLYNGAISVSPVPEAEVWAMMLIGAGLVGFQLRRKSKQSATARFV